MSAKKVYQKVKHNPETMENKLPSAEDMKKFTCGSGHNWGAKLRKSIKKGTTSARRRVDKEIISSEIEEKESK